MTVINPMNVMDPQKYDVVYARNSTRVYTTHGYHKVQQLLNLTDVQALELHEAVGNTVNTRRGTAVNRGPLTQEDQDIHDAWVARNLPTP